MVQEDLTSNLSDRYNKMLDKFQIDTINGIWAFQSFINDTKNNRFGFKIHVSALSHNCLEIGYKVLFYLNENRIPFKICKNLNELINLNNAKYGYSQVGKFITIYPDQDESINKHLMNLNLLTKHYRSLSIPSDYPYLNSEVIYYRYGEISNTSSNKVDFIDKRIKYIPSSIDNIIEYSSINRYSSIPDHLYPLSIIENSKKSIILICINSIKNNINVLKIGKHLSDIESNYVDSADRILHEYKMMVELNDIEEIIKPISIMMINNDIAVLEEFIDGKTLFDILKNSTNNNIDKKTILLNLVEVVKKVHQRNIYIGDLSLGNIMIENKSKRLRVIDLEYFGYINDEIFEYYKNGTLGFYRKCLTKKMADLFALLKIIYYMFNPQIYFKEVEINFKEVESTNKDAVSLFKLNLEEFQSVNNYDKVLNNINRTLESLIRNDT
ncbi:protein kinase domain-containing protein [Phocicoccus pinnipedialis]|nr:hypothetical protein [Jeotgalicoccus pinnipedialis]MBP1939862.1 tRNA A-37 threonylcarbamoyl transferase component Bud32 [Jeotgalicoccus pinnipedialis]